MFSCCIFRRKVALMSMHASGEKRENIARFLVDKIRIKESFRMPGYKIQHQQARRVRDAFNRSKE
jgi:hypothetical protein